LGNDAMVAVLGESVLVRGSLLKRDSVCEELGAVCGFREFLYSSIASRRRLKFLFSACSRLSIVVERVLLEEDFGSGLGKFFVRIVTVVETNG